MQVEEYDEKLTEMQKKLTNSELTKQMLT